VKVEIETNGKRRTYDLGALDRVRAYYEIVDQVKILKTGHPDFNSIHKFGEEVMAELVEDAG
jgi:hypothetical protein